MSLSIAGCSSSNSTVKTGNYKATPSADCGSAKPVPEEALPIIEDGDTDFEISGSSLNSPEIGFAAIELKNYLQQASEAKLPIAEENDSRSRIELAVSKNIANCDGQHGHDSFSVFVDDDVARLVGATPRAVLYAAYDVLERDAGVRWLSPGADGEVVPQVERFSITPLDGVEAPDFSFRAAGAFPSEVYQLWAVRNKLQVASWGQKRHDKITRRDGYLRKPDPHRFYQTFPKDKYESQHPDWFSENQLDVTEESLRNAFVQKIRAYFDANPEVVMFPVTPNDGYGWPASAHPSKDLEAQRKAGHPTRIRHHKSVSERYFDFVADVANRVKATHPSKYLYALAYVNYVYPPVRMESLPENVIVSITHYTPADYSKPINDESSEPNLQFASILQEWATKCARPWLYAYTVKYALDCLPFPIAYRLGTDIDYMRELGYTGFYSQGGEGRWGQYGPHFYVMAKKLWNADSKVDDLLDTYFLGMAGNGAESAREGYETLVAALKSMDETLNRHPLREARDYLSDDVLDRAANHYESAYRKAATARTQRNIRAMQIPLQYSRKYFSMRSALETYEANGYNEDLARALESWNEIRELVKSHKSLDALPISLINPDGYFTLHSHFEPHLDQINTSGEDWTVADS